MIDIRIMRNLSEFYDEILSLPNKFEEIPLKQFLIGLYNVVEESKDETPSFDLFLNLIHSSLGSKESNFNQEWLAILTPPNEDMLDGYSYTLNAIRFQIAEMHKMEGKELLNPHKSFGIVSSTGNHWYNFDPFTNLECGASYFIDREEDVEVTWKTLGELLEAGRIYE